MSKKKNKSIENEIKNVPTEDVEKVEGESEIKEESEKSEEPEEKEEPKEAEESEEKEESEKTEESEEKEGSEKTEEPKEKEEPKETEEPKEKEDSEKSEESEKKEESEKDSKLFIDEPFIDPSLYAHNRKKKVVKTVMLSFLALVLITYFSGLIYFLSHFNSNTTINGIDVSYLSISDTEKTLLKDANNYSLTVEFKNEDYVIHLGDGDTKAELKEDVSDILKRHTPFLWFVDLFKDYDYTTEYTVSYDEEKLAAYLDQSESMNTATMEGPVNASVKLENGEVVVIAEKTGTLLDKNLVYEKVEYALTNYIDSVNLAEMNCYVEAHITTESDSIVKAKEEAEEFLNIKACYDFGDYVYQIPKEELCTMAYISDDGTVKISKNNVVGYVNRFASKFSTVGTEREFKTHDNKIFKIYGEEYGWVIDTATEAEELYDKIVKKKDFTKEPACERRGYTMCEMNDIGDSYVEVDLTNQHIYVYKKGKLKVDSDCVTGHTPGHKTPGGLYGITYTKLHAVLKGADYETPVTFWMPFNRGIGLHDANWRSKFGGDIYTRDGSHGCVNLPYDIAGEVFDIVEQGMPVVCYWRDEVEEVK